MSDAIDAAEGGQAAGEFAESGEFLELVTEFQPRLYGYVMSLLGDREAASEVLQETNVVIWRKAAEFQPNTSFKAWAFRIASFQVMAWRQRQIRDRLVFDEGVLERLDVRASERDEDFTGRRDRLEECLRKLPDRQRELILARYLDGASVVELAVQTQRTANAVSQLLFRARKNLLDCLGRSAATEA
jgi:RNA polymerase sigma-70 factor (ECF subfamily)